MKIFGYDDEGNEIECSIEEAAEHAAKVHHPELFPCDEIILLPGFDTKPNRKNESKR